MRQGQQNRRGRGRHNNNNNHNQNRKGQNPLTRSFESNGPDVKIRGTPAHIAEKYLSLARDASASGDPVLAENYFQHAEHYNRIIMAFREQQIQQSGGDVNVGMRHRPAFGDQTDGDEFGDDDADEFNGEAPAHRSGHEPQPRVFDPAQQPQPYGRFDDQGNPMPQRSRHERQGGEGFRGRDHRDNREFRARDHRDHRDREPREPREPREQREPREPREHREFRGEPRPQREFRGEPREPVERQPIEAAAGPAAPQAEQPAIVEAPAVATPPRARRDRFGQGNEQPEFLRRPVRRPRREQPASEANAEAPAAPGEAAPDEPVV